MKTPSCDNEIPDFSPQLKLFIPIITKSEANISEHWTKKRKRVCAQKTEIFFALFNAKITTPCKITLIRQGGRKMDSDNLVISFKYVKDGISEHIRPGLAPGKADDDEELISWQYEQSSAKPKGITIVIQ